MDSSKSKIKSKKKVAVLENQVMLPVRGDSDSEESCVCLTSNENIFTTIEES